MTGTSPGDDVTVTLRLPPNAAHVRTARLIAAAMARRSGVGEDVLDEVRLAVGEACARAVRMQERQGVVAPVTLEFGESGRFSVSVLDGAKTGTGSGDEITAVAGGGGPAAPWADPSGDSLGLALLGAVVQDLDVDENGEGGTRVTMSWPVA
jgi:anti-sigma regulatory factor (Ser/Thr protein kinase)